MQWILSHHNVHGQVAYLDNAEATVGPVRAVGSPFANYISHNDAFNHANPVYIIEIGVHIVVTHMPAALPVKKEWHVSMPMKRSLNHCSGPVPYCTWADVTTGPTACTLRSPSSTTFGSRAWWRP